MLLILSGERARSGANIINSVQNKRAYTYM